MIHSSNHSLSTEDYIEDDNLHQRSPYHAADQQGIQDLRGKGSKFRLKETNIKAMEMDCNSIIEVLIQKKIAKINQEIEDQRTKKRWYVENRMKIRSVRRSIKMDIHKTLNIEKENRGKVRYMYTIVDELEEVSHLMRFEIDSIGIEIDELLSLRRSYMADLNKIKTIQLIRG